MGQFLWCLASMTPLSQPGKLPLPKRLLLPGGVFGVDPFDHFVVCLDRFKRLAAGKNVGIRELCNDRTSNCSRFSSFWRSQHCKTVERTTMQTRRAVAQ